MNVSLSPVLFLSEVGSPLSPNTLGHGALLEKKAMSGSWSMPGGRSCLGLIHSAHSYRYFLGAGRRLPLSVRATC